MSQGPKDSLTQQTVRSEDNPERLQQEKDKVNQANQQKGTLDDQATRYVAIKSGNIRRAGVTQATNLQIQEVQGVSKERY